MKRINSLIITYAILMLCLAVILFPVFLMVLLSITPRSDLFRTFLPTSVTLDNFIWVVTNVKIMRPFLNSLIIASGTAVFSLSLSLPGAYGLSRFNFGWKGSLILFILLAQMFPMEVLILSYFQIVSRWAGGLYNTLFLLILLDSTLAVPFCTLMLKSAFDAIPEELENAAMIDGCSKSGAFFRVCLPLTWAGVVATGFFAFLMGWIEFLYGLTFTLDYKTFPMTVKVAELLGHFITHWGELMAMSFLFSLVILIGFAFLQKTFLKGVIAGAVKG